jgi:hypothetical protein
MSAKNVMLKKQRRESRKVILEIRKTALKNRKAILEAFWYDVMGMPFLTRCQLAWTIIWYHRDKTPDIAKEAENA